MAGRYVREIEIKAKTDQAEKEILNIQELVDELKKHEYKVSIGVDSQKLEKVIGNLEKMLDSLGKGTGDFKQFENLSKELSGVISEVQSLSKAFGKVDDSGTQTLLSSIQSIDKSLSSLSEHILNVNKDFGNVGKNASNNVQDINAATTATEKLAEVTKDLGKAQQNLNGNKSNISSENINAVSDNSSEQEAKEIQKVWEDNLKAITDYMDAKTKLNNLEASDKKSNKKSNEIADLTNEVEKARLKAEEARTTLSSMVNPHDVDINTWDKWLKMMEEFRQAGEGSSQSIAKLKDAIANVNTSELTSIQKYIDSAQSKLNTTDKSREDSEKSSDFKNYVKQVQEDIDAIVAEKQRLENALESGDIEIIDESQLSRIKDLKQSLVEANLGFKTIFKGSADVSRWKEIDTITKYMEKNTRISKEAKIQFQGFIEELKTKGADANVEKIHQSFLEVCDVERKARREGQSFLDVLRDKAWYGFAAQIGTYFSFNDIMRYGKEVISNVIEIDTALTELRKVSDTTEARLTQNFENSAKTAKELGAAITDVISATSDWSKMGYDIDEAEELARVSILYTNVGDGIDVTEANESLISTLQGFQLDASEAESVIDKFNEVANRYAIDSAGIGEALQRSAASFNAANTDLSKSIALITATRLYRLVEYMETCIKNIFNCHRSLYYHSLQCRGNYCMNV